MHHLHTNIPPIIHRDLKSLNLLFTTKIENSQSKINVKVADFGLSRIKNSSEDMQTVKMTGGCGTYHWMAPEVIKGEIYNQKIDV